VKKYNAKQWIINKKTKMKKETNKIEAKEKKN
jgi:hypothetical protein